jgi:hypothetical protein
MFGFISLLYGLEARASSSADLFLRTLQGKGQPYNMNFWNTGLRSLSGITFTDESAYSYLVFFNTLTLPKSLSYPSGTLKAFHQIPSTNLGFLAHEAFHSYIANHVMIDRKAYSKQRWMQFRSQNLYRDEGIESSKAYVALEEAYATFVGNMVMSARGLELSIGRMADRGDVDCERSMDFIQKRWAVDWNQEVKGYYYRDSYGDYYSDQLRHLWSRVTGGEPPPLDTERYVLTALQRADRDWISREVFEGNFSESPTEFFNGLLVQLGCEF